jgi:hypothetical protein
MSDFDSYLDLAWGAHADQPEAVAAGLVGTGLPMLCDEARLLALARLAHHLHGEHLGLWQEGIGFQHRLAGLPVCGAEGAATTRRHVASLSLAAGLPDLRGEMSASDRIRVGALAAASLVARDLPRASALLHQALAEAEAAGLPDGDPYARALAVTGNNLACELEERPQRSADERTLMILAAQTARRYWARAGGWRETARAEYRLGMTWLRAGDAELAGWHAQQCLDITRSHGGLAMDRFLAWEVVASSARARADMAGAALALTELQATLTEVDEGDRVWCRSRWTELAGPSP